MGFTTGITTRDAGFPALMVLNAVFGGGLTSKLFLHVREKLSLCYYASSSVYGAKGILTVSSGIETCNYQQAKRRFSGSWPPARPGRSPRRSCRQPRRPFAPVCAPFRMRRGGWRTMPSSAF